MIPSPVLFDRAEIFNGGSGVYTNPDPATATRPLYYKRVHLQTINHYVFPEASATRMPCIPGETLYAAHTVERYNTAVAGEYVVLVLQWFRADGNVVSSSGEIASTKVFSTDLPGGVPITAKGSAIVPPGISFVRIYTAKGNGSSTQFGVAEHYLGRTEQGSDVTTIVDGPKSWQFEYDYLNNALTGEFNRVLRYALYKQGVKVTTPVTARWQIKSGQVNGAVSGSTWYGLTINDQNQAETTITSLEQDSVVVIEMTSNNIPRTLEVALTRHKNAAPKGALAEAIISGSVASAVGSSSVISQWQVLVPAGRTSLAVAADVTMNQDYAKNTSGTYQLHLQKETSPGNYVTQASSAAATTAYSNFELVSSAELSASFNDSVTAGTTVKYQVVVTKTATAQTQMSASGSGSYSVV
jgi:hypothetical protein